MPNYLSQVDEGLAAGAGGVELEEGSVQPSVRIRPKEIQLFI